MMSPTSTRASADDASRSHASVVSFSALPSTTSTSGIAAKRPGSVCAAQPVTTIRAPGLSRRSRRICWRAWRTASAVTAQLLTTTVSEMPAPSASPFIASVS